MVKATNKRSAPKNSHERLNKIILDNVPVSVITIGKNGDITSVNKYFKNFSSESGRGKKNIFSNKFFIRENLLESYRELLAKGTAFRRDDCHQINQKGEDKYLRITAVPFRNEKGKIEGAISLASDNTVAVKFKNELIKLNNSLEEKIKHRTEDLNRLNKELHKVSELKSVFIADVSHEFKTSLAIMQGNLELLTKICNPNKQQKGLFTDAIDEIKRASKMMTDLILLTKSNSSELKLNYEKFDLTSLLILICKKMEVVAREKKIKIEYDKKNPPIEILASKGEVERLFSNLIRNAIKYNKEDGKIKIRLNVKAKDACIEVEDTGIGIPEKDLPYIFERFYRVDKSEDRSEGTGLGLAICKYVAEAHGGNISVQSKYGEGSTFTVRLPLIPQNCKNGKCP